ncbi:hypothetical protein [Sporosarcina sp. FSL K6-1508]|uniref:hypothetical protein n=1 Tax=Sporosarcina sp. FSL K6-1508 TaxID=2921553 RepID=UPI0030FC153B
MNSNEDAGIFNPKLIIFIKKDNNFIILLAAIYAIIPLMENEVVLTFIIALISISFGVLLNWILGTEWDKFPQFILFVCIRMLFLLLGMIFVILFLIRTTTFNLNIEIAISWYLPLILLIGTLEFLVLMIIYLDKIHSIESPKKKLVIITVLLGLYIAAYVFSGISFSYGYMTLIETIYKIKIDESDSFYLSFLISNTLPINDNVFLKYIALINSNNHLQAYQYFHIYSHKFIELSIIAIILKVLLGLFKFKNDTSVD